MPLQLRYVPTSWFSDLFCVLFRALDVAAGLRTWRNGVATATSAAQLSMCVTMLDTCIHWQRAPKVGSAVVCFSVLVD